MAGMYRIVVAALSHPLQRATKLDCPLVLLAGAASRDALRPKSIDSAELDAPAPTSSIASQPAPSPLDHAEPDDDDAAALNEDRPATAGASPAHGMLGSHVAVSIPFTRAT